MIWSLQVAEKAERAAHEDYQHHLITTSAVVVIDRGSLQTSNPPQVRPSVVQAFDRVIRDLGQKKPGCRIRGNTKKKHELMMIDVYICMC